MTDIPEDVMRLARKAVAEQCALHDYAGRPAWEAIIAHAILADRAAQAERMARLEEALKPIINYVNVRHRAPLRGIGDSVHMIHGGTAFEAELRFSDLEQVARALSQEGSDA